MHRSRSLLLLVALLAPPMPAIADLRAGLAAWEQGDYEGALAEWLPLAEQGDAEAQFRMGRLYLSGQGVQPSDEQAVAWYRRAAEQGHARAQSSLGYMYDTGRGVPEDAALAAEWYLKAAEQGRAVAQANLARLYEQGRGVARDDGRAAAWYGRAAAQGDAEARVRLGAMLEGGRGVERDDARAAKLYRKAAGQDDPEAAYRLGRLYAEGRGVGRNLQKAERWYDRADELGWAVGRPALEALDGGEPETATATAAPAPSEQGPTDAAEQYDLGKRYALGDGLPRDGGRAELWLSRAAEQGHGLAAYRLGFLFLRGQGASRDKDFVMAYAWFEMAARSGVGDAAVWRDKVLRKMSATERSAAEAWLASRQDQNDL